MSIQDELPKDFKPVIILGEIDGYLHIFSFLDDETILTILEMAEDSISSKDYDVDTTPMH